MTTSRRSFRLLPGRPPSDRPTGWVSRNPDPPRPPRACLRCPSGRPASGRCWRPCRPISSSDLPAACGLPFRLSGSPVPSSSNRSRRFSGFGSPARMLSRRAHLPPSSETSHCRRRAWPMDRLPSHRGPGLPCPSGRGRFFPCQSFPDWSVPCRRERTSIVPMSLRPFVSRPICPPVRVENSSRPTRAAGRLASRRSASGRRPSPLPWMTPAQPAFLPTCRADRGRSASSGSSTDRFPFRRSPPASRTTCPERPDPLSDRPRCHPVCCLPASAGRPSRRAGHPSQVQTCSPPCSAGAAVLPVVSSRATSAVP